MVIYYKYRKRPYRNLIKKKLYDMYDIFYYIITNIRLKNKDNMKIRL
jgi:hypothetical protein